MDIFGNEQVIETSCPYCHQSSGHYDECPESYDLDDTPEMQEMIEPDIDALPFIDQP